MSHNKIKVAGQAPNKAGEITVNVGDLNDVTVTSAGAGQYLQYSGTTWENVTPSLGTGEFILFGQGETNNYSNSGAANLNAGTTLRLYDTSPINTISGATLNVTSGSANANENNWLTSIDLPAGDYLLTAGVGVEFSASGYLGFKFHDGSNNASHIAYTGESVTTFDGAAGFIQSYLSLSSADTLTFQIHAVSGVDTIANQGSTISEFTQIMIIQVG